MRACDVGNGAEVIDGWQEGAKHRVGDRIKWHRVVRQK